MKERKKLMQAKENIVDEYVSHIQFKDHKLLVAGTDAESM